MIQIQLEATISLERGKSDDDVCMRLVEVRLYIPVYAKKHEWVSFSVPEPEIDNLLSAAGDWLKARRVPAVKVGNLT